MESTDILTQNLIWFQSFLKKMNELKSEMEEFTSTFYTIFQNVLFYSVGTIDLFVTNDIFIYMEHKDYLHEVAEKHGLEISEIVSIYENSALRTLTKTSYEILLLVYLYYLTDFCGYENEDEKEVKFEELYKAMDEFKTGEPVKEEYRNLFEKLSFENYQAMIKNILHRNILKKTSLCLIREHCPDSLLSSDYLPLDMFKLILKETHLI